MKAAGRIGKGAFALAMLGAGPLACVAEPSIPLRVSLTIPEICTIDAAGGPGARAGTGGDAPSVSCVHGTPFLLSRAQGERAALLPPRSPGIGGPAAWTVTF
ncbi:hypothetical protein B7G54_18890 [Burkholderia puraquae]|uniref:Uncharacterized protein n=1 Tax=Burkholderia puraquae TaxID=1904757 RepID=A0A1X1PEZ6_9BURK|nr:hypothetical protein [Burkholderia puraquae]ORT84628.1 hypothetical protein B7G54_18890 [Burkholderia puraquae]CAB3761885.1 hypothetical protein LMG29660_04373 [Burkholderia puraquae]